MSGHAAGKRVAGRVSVIMPVLDAAAYLREAIDSVVAQTWTDWELVVVDDGSTDGSLEIARELERRFADRIRVLGPEGEGRRGASRARNRGIAAATGSYIGLLDADDVWLPEKLAEHVPRLEARPDVGFVFGPTLWWYGWTGAPEDAARDAAPPVGPAREVVLAGERALELMLRHRLAVPCTCGLLARADLVEEVGGFDERFSKLYTDQSFYAKLLLRRPVMVTLRALDRYRQHPESACNSASPETLREARRTYLDWLLAYLRDSGCSAPAVARAARADRRWLDRSEQLRRLRRFYLKRTHGLIWAREPTGAPAGTTPPPRA